MMFWVKLKLAAAVVAGVLVVGGVGGTVAGKMLAGEPAGPKPVETGAQEQSLKCQVTALLAGGKVTLNAGSEQGARLGFEFEVSRDGQKVGTVKAVAVEARSLTAELLSATGEIKVGDLATTRFRAVAQPAPRSEKEPPAGGEAVNGFSLSLAGPTDEAGSKFSLTWKNVGGKLLELQWVRRGSDGAYYYLDDLRGHVFLKGADGNLAPATAEKPHPFIQAPYRPRTVLVEPEKSHEESFALWDYVQKPGKPGKYRLWVELEVTNPFAPRAKDATYWSGKIRSNEIEVDLKAGGEAVDGLKFTISADKLEAKAGDTVNIDLNFENVSKEAMHILKFDYLTLDWELVAPDGESLLPAPTAMPGLLPPGAKDYPELKAGGKLAWRSKAISGNPPAVYVGPAANYRNVYLVKPGTYKLTAVYALKEGQGQGVAPGKVWAGTVRSNALEIKFEGDFKAPAMPGKWPPAGIPGVTFAQEPAKPAAGAPDEATAVKLAREFLAGKGVKPVKLTAFSIPAPAAGWWLVEYTLAGGLAVSPGPCVYVEKQTGKVTEKAPPGMPARM